MSPWLHIGGRRLGLRWQAERDIAFGGVGWQTEANGYAKAPSPLRFAGAVQDATRQQLQALPQAQPLGGAYQVGQ